MLNYDNSGMKVVCYAAGVCSQLIAYLSVTTIKARAGTVAVAYRYHVTGFIICPRNCRLAAIRFQ